MSVFYSCFWLHCKLSRTGFKFLSSVPIFFFFSTLNYLHLIPAVPTHLFCFIYIYSLFFLLFFSTFRVYSKRFKVLFHRFKLFLYLEFWFTSFSALLSFLGFCRNLELTFLSLLPIFLPILPVYLLLTFLFTCFCLPSYL